MEIKNYCDNNLTTTDKELSRLHAQSYAHINYFMPCGQFFDEGVYPTCRLQ